MPNKKFNLRSKLSAQFHTLAKDSGNKLRAYILAIASGGTAVIFTTLTGDNQPVTNIEKWSLSVAIVGFFFTVALSLWELRIDAKRAYHIAKQYEKKRLKQDWSSNKYYNRLRLRLINLSYFSLATATIALAIYTICRIYW